MTKLMVRCLGSIDISSAQRPEKRRQTLALALCATLCVAMNVTDAQPGGGTSSGRTSTENKSPGPAEPGLLEISQSAVEYLVGQLNLAESQEQTRRWQSYHSPRHTVMTFLHGMKDAHRGAEDGWRRALGALGENSQQSVDTPREAARQLYAVLSRLGEIEAFQLPGPSLVSEQSMTRYEVFPYGLPHKWVWEALKQAPQGEIVVAQNASDNWHFTAETISGASTLLNSMASLPPRYTDQPAGHIFLSTLEKISETPPKSWLAMFISLLSGCAAGVLVAWAVKRLAQQLRHRRREYLRGAVRSLAAPLGLAPVAIGVSIGFSFVALPSALDDLHWFAVRFLVLAAAALFVFRVVDLFAIALRHWAGRNGSRYDETSALLLRRVLQTVAVILLVIFFLQSLVGMDVTALLGGLGLLGLALSLAGQGVFKNALGGINIFINQPFLVGDWIAFGDTWGEVEDVGLYATKMRLLSGELMTVPNMRFIDETVTNLDERRYLRRTMDVALPYHSSHEDVRRAIELAQEVLSSAEVIDEGRCQLERKPPHITFNEFAEDHLNIRVYYWYFIEDGNTVQRDSNRGWYDYLEHCSLVNLKLKQAFEEAGIKLALPAETHYLETPEQRRLQISCENKSPSSNTAEQNDS